MPRPRNAKLPPPTKSGNVGPSQKRAIISLVDRSAKNVRSFHVPVADAETVAKIVRENVHKESACRRTKAAFIARSGLSLPP